MKEFLEEDEMVQEVVEEDLLIEEEVEEDYHLESLVSTTISSSLSPKSISRFIIYTSLSTLVKILSINCVNCTIKESLESTTVSKLELDSH